MSIWDLYGYINKHDLNLDWLLKTVDETAKKVAELEVAQGMPPVTAADNGKLAEVINGAWAASIRVPEVLEAAQSDLLGVGARVTVLERQMADVYPGIADIAVQLAAINAGILEG